MDWAALFLGIGVGLLISVVLDLVAKWGNRDTEGNH